MPHLTLPLSPQGGCRVQVGVGITEARVKALAAKGESPPAVQVVTALIDTGASISAIDFSIVKALGLTPRGVTPVHTPSTGPKPVSTFLYDVTVFLYDAQTQYLVDRAIPVIGSQLKVQGFEVLLGRDILQDCFFMYDGRAGQFTLGF